MTWLTATEYILGVDDHMHVNVPFVVIVTILSFFPLIIGPLTRVPWWPRCHWWSRYRFEWSATDGSGTVLSGVPLMEQVPFWVECHWWIRYRFKWSATDGAGTVLSGVFVVQSLVFCILSTIVCFLGHCIVCPLSMFVSYPLASFNFFFHKFFVSYQHKAVEIS